MEKVSKMFGEFTFGKSVMRDKLNKDAYEKIMATIENGDALDDSLAADVAHAMKNWALELGATHYTHWFQPQRGGTAEKHEAFIEYDEYGGIIERFRGSSLIQSEPDASSFPSGGMRSTFEARGYTAWDPTSPAFLIKSGDRKTLVIPSVFLSWTGHVMDLKTPMLRSQKALNDSVMRVQKLLGNRYAKRIKVFIGAEQEYFLVSKEHFANRQDLQICGRTLLGAPPAKGQQMADHYFGAIKDNVLAFMEELDLELYRRGIPSKTRHNEVAPNQFEIVPLYEESNLAVDHNLQVMDIMKRVASRHDLVALLHEKPLAGVNGSGKHVNWSMADNSGANYLTSSKSPLKNINFLVTVGAILLGLDKHGSLLRAVVADAANDHRLGAHEAPPAIISVYLGSYLSNLLDEIESIGKLTTQKMDKINLGIRNLPQVAKDISDRNRTSPLAFTGNKFEFRAVGSSQSCAESVMALNLLVAYGYDYFYEKLQMMSGEMKENVILVLRDILKKTKKVRFEGNGYSMAWIEEAKKRGLENIKNTPEALKIYLRKDVIALFSKYKILSKIELKSKVEIKLDNYIKTIDIELKTVLNMAKTLVNPAILEHLKLQTDLYASLISMGIEAEDLKTDIDYLYSLFSEIHQRIKIVHTTLTECEAIVELEEKAVAYATKGCESMGKLRAVIDETEVIIPEKLWAISKYQDILAAL